MESHRLSKFNSDGKLVKSVGGEGSRTGQFDQPHGIALSKDNKLFVCDSDNNRIQVFDTNLKYISCFGKEGSCEGEFRWPFDLTFDPAGDVYVTEWGNHRVQVLSHDGRFLRFGRCGGGPGELSWPEGIHVDHDYVYVVEFGNQCSTHLEHLLPHLAGGAMGKETCITHMGSPSTRMDSCMSVTLRTIAFKYFDPTHICTDHNGLYVGHPQTSLCSCSVILWTVPHWHSMLG